MEKTYDSISQYIHETILPTGLVISTPYISQNTFKKNNLTPSEFFRPFVTYGSSIIVSKNMVSRVPSYKFDLYDSESFHPLNQKEIGSYIHSLLLNKTVKPNWKLSYPLISKNKTEHIRKIIRDYNYPWINEMEKLLFDYCKFNNFEGYQQPLIGFYVCGLHENLSIVDWILDKKNLPEIIKNGVYYMPVVNILIVLNDFSDKMVYVPPEKQDVIKNVFRDKYEQKIKILFFDINTEEVDNKDDKSPSNSSINDVIDDNDNDKNIDVKKVYNDLWKKNIHACDLYFPSNDDDFNDNSTNPTNSNNQYAPSTSPNKSNQVTYGKYISTNDILLIKTKIRKTFMHYIYFKLLDEIELLESNPNLSLHRKFELCTFLYFTDQFNKAITKLKELSKEVKKENKANSTKLILSINEMKALCNIHLGNFTIKKYKKIFKSYFENNNKLQAIRWFILKIKALEINNEFDLIKERVEKFKNKFLKSEVEEVNAITKIYKVNNLRIVQPFKKFLEFYIPMLTEKKGIYSLIQNNNYRKFILYNIESKVNFSRTYSVDYYNYTIFFYTTFLWLIRDTNNRSFLFLKMFLNNELGDMCREIHYKEGEFYFYRILLELTKYYPHKRKLINSNSNNINIINKNNNSNNKNKLSQKYDIDDEKKYLKLYLQSMHNITKENINILDLSLNIHSLNLIEIDKKSLYFITQEDINIKSAICSKGIKSRNYLPWLNFRHYELINFWYAHLVPNDITIIREIDNIIVKKNSIKNWDRQKYIKGSIGDSLYVVFNIYNPLMIGIELSDIKLICDFYDTDNLNNNIASLDNNAIETEKININLDGRHIKSVQLYVKALKKGAIIIKGIQVTINKIATIEYFLKAKNKNKMYNYVRKKSRLFDDELESGFKNKNIALSIIENAKKNLKKSQWVFNIIDDDIFLQFPQGNQITCYNHQIIFFPLVVYNNSSYRINKFTIFIDELIKIDEGNDNYKENKRKFNLNNFITVNKKLNQENKSEQVLIPFIPNKVGLFYFKCLLKFEEEHKLNYVESKRFIIVLYVKPSIKYEISDQLEKFQDSIVDNSNNNSLESNIKLHDPFLNKEVFFKAKTQISISNIEELESIQINNIYHNKDIKQTLNQQSNENKEISNKNQKSSKYFSEFSFSTCKITTNNYQSNKSCILDPDIPYNKQPFLIEYESIFQPLFKYNKQIIKEQPHIIYGLGKLLHDKTQMIIFQWSSEEKKTNKFIGGLILYNCKFYDTKINYFYCLDKIVLNSIKYNITQIKLDCHNTFICLNIIFNRQNLLYIRNIVWYEINVNKDRELDWVGNIKYKFNNNLNSFNGNDEDLVEKLNFNLVCESGKRINIDDVYFKLHFVDEEKEINFNSGNFYFKTNNVVLCKDLLVE